MEGGAGVGIGSISLGAGRVVGAGIGDTGGINMGLAEAVGAGCLQDMLQCVLKELL